MEFSKSEFIGFVILLFILLIDVMVFSILDRLLIEWGVEKTMDRLLLFNVEYYLIACGFFFFPKIKSLWIKRFGISIRVDDLPEMDFNQFLNYFPDDTDLLYTTVTGQTEEMEKY